MHEKERQGLRVIEEEIMEVLFDLHFSKNQGERIKSCEIINSLDDKLKKNHLTNIIRRKLEPKGYVNYLPYKGVKLTKLGFQIALRIARNHRLSEAMLYQIFDIPFNQLHEQACYLEHGITDIIARAIYRKLKVKKTPFGMPIPMDDRNEDLGCEDKCLHEIPTGTRVTLTRIQNHHRYTAKELETYDIHTVGVKIDVKSTGHDGVVVEIDENLHTIPLQLSRHLCVKR